MSAKIKKNVYAYIGAISNYPAANIQDDFVLKDHPLRLDDQQLAFLAMSLRGYIKSINRSMSISVSDLRKRDLTAKKTYELVNSNL